MEARAGTGGTGAGAGARSPAHRLATLGALAGGAAWGAFWVPVRALEAAGFAGLWPVAWLYGTGVLLLLPVYAARLRRLVDGGWRLQVAGVFMGGAMAAYAGAFLYTEVVPAVLLYYLSPVWGFLLARVFQGDPVTPVRWVAMALALGGAAVVFGPDNWPPMPRNTGDWMALASGMAFVAGATMMLARPGVSSIDYSLSFFFWAAFGTAVIALLAGTPLPDGGALAGTLWWLLPVVGLLLAPGCFAAIHGASVLNPGLVSILYMAEIGVALVLAALLTDEAITRAQVLGVVMISLAGALEGLLGLWRQRRQRRRAAHGR